MRVKLAGISAARIYVEHFIYKLLDMEVSDKYKVSMSRHPAAKYKLYGTTYISFQPILEASATVVCLDEKHRPTRVSSELSLKLLQFFSEVD